jgi:hypothetical protein
VPHEDPRQQGHMAQSDNDKCQVDSDISGMWKSQIRVTHGSY